MIYLAKDGQTFGPYQETDIERLRASGELNRYAYIWDQSKGTSWEALELAPIAPPPPPDAQIAAPAAPSTRATSAPRSFGSVSGMGCMLFDGRFVVQAQIKSVSESGLELRGLGDAHGDFPFSPHSRLTLHLFDEKSGNAENVPARIVALRRIGGSWEFQVSWRKIPSLVPTRQARAA